VESIIKEITYYLKKNGYDIIYSGADGIIGKGSSLKTKEIVSYVRKLNSSFTFSIGIGETLRDCFISLKYAKANNKNVAVELNSKEFTLVR